MPADEIRGRAAPGMAAAFYGLVLVGRIVSFFRVEYFTIGNLPLLQHGSPIGLQMLKSLTPHAHILFGKQDIYVKSCGDFPAENASLFLRNVER